jgi:1,3,6,8-tetrahydroxynaphthalene synthase
MRHDRRSGDTVKGSGPLGRSSAGFPAVACGPAVALPRNVLTREDLEQVAREHLGPDFPHLRRVLEIIRNSGIERRYLVQSLAETLRMQSFAARNQLFVREVCRLGKEAASAALDAAELSPQEIDLVITTSCTGIMIPSLCAHLLPEMGFRASTKRLPITELGCAAGAAALSRAREFCQAYPGANVLIVATELCSLTFQPSDLSFQALVGAILFGDGAGACVVRGKHVPGLRLEANASFLFPNSLGYMGFELRDTGLHLMLDKGIPSAVEEEIAPVVNDFLERNGLRARDLDFFCLHPGGRRILEEMERVFDLEDGDAAASWECLAEVGNLSSASIFVVLKNLFERHTPKAQERGFIAAFGPGFSAEMCLGTWSAGE